MKESCVHAICSDTFQFMRQLVLISTTSGSAYHQQDPYSCVVEITNKLDNLLLLILIETSAILEISAQIACLIVESIASLCLVF